MGDWRDKQLRYLCHFSDGGAGMRYRDDELREGDELHDGGARYRVVRVEQPPAGGGGFGHAWLQTV